MSIIEYKPYPKRTVDHQYKNLLRNIMNTGRVVRPIHGEEARMIAGHQMRFDMSNGFPFITERDLSEMWEAPLGELIGFMHGARTHKELAEYGCNFWKRWVTQERCAMFGLPEGDLGEGSYGVVWTKFPIGDGETFNQIKAVMKQIVDMPYLRTHRITNWLPPHVMQWEGRVRDTVVAPCHGDVHFIVYPEDKEMDVHHVQRSGDLPVGVPFNFVHYAALGMMVAHVIGYTFNELIYTFSDVHIYERQYEHVKTLLRQETRPFPTVTINTTITDIFDFRPEHFTLTDYHPNSKMFIPTPT